MKKIISFILICLFVFQSASALAYYDVTSTGSEALLYDLGILPEEYEDNSILTRGMFAAYCTRLITKNPDNAVSTDEIADLDDDNEYRNEILNAYFYGLIDLDKENKFYPNDNIKYEDALDILVALIGGKEFAKKTGKDAYSILGSSAYVPRPSSGYVDFKTYKQMMTNIIKVNIFTRGSLGELDNTDKETVLSGYLDLTEVTGFVSECAYTGVSKESKLSDNQLVLKTNNSDLILSTKLSKDDIYSLLGRNVRVYYREEDGEDVVISVRCTGRDKVLEIKSSDIDKSASTKGRIVYDSETGRRKYASILPSADVIYNRNVLRDYVLEDLLPSDGKLELISTDGSNQYDIVKIFKYDYTLVNSVNTEEKYIVDMYKLHNLDLEKDEIDIYSDGEKIELSKINRNDLIVSEKAKNGELKAVRILKNRVVGKVQSVGNSEVTIDGQTYKISEFYNNLANADKRPKEFIFFRAGTDCCALADENGNLVALVEMDNKGKVRYAYLIKLFGEDDKSIAKVLNTSGDVESIDMADKVAIDGKSVKRQDVNKTMVTSYGKPYVESSTGYDIGAVIRMNTDENGNINYIDTEKKDERIEGSDSLEKSIPKSSQLWAIDAGSFSGNARLDSTSIIFKVPTVPSSNRDDYSIISSSSLAFSTYDVEFYNIKRNGVASVAAIYIDSELQGNIDGWDPIYIVGKKLQVYNESNDEIYDVLRTYSLSGVIDLTIDKKSEINIDSVNLGDIIRVGRNFNGYVNKIETVMNIKDTTKPFKSSTNFTGSYWFWFGKVLYAEDNVLCADFSEDGSEKLYFDVTEPFASRCHYVFDCATKQVSTIDLPNINGFEDYGDGDWVFLYSWKGKIKDVVIYRNFDATR